MVKAVALFDYKAGEKGETNLTAGATVHVISKGSGVWWLVECNGFAGYVPPAYVEVLPDEQQEEPFEVLAVYTHEASSETEITFFEGERVLVLESDNAEWWYGVIRSSAAGHEGQRVAGYFASNFVERVQASEPPAVMQRRLATMRAMKPSLPQRPDLGTLPRPRSVDKQPPKAAAEELRPPLPSREDRELLIKLERERMRAAKLEQDALEKAAKLAQSQSEIQVRDSEISKMRAKEEAMNAKMAEMEAALQRERERAEAAAVASARAAEVARKEEELAERERALAEERDREAERRRVEQQEEEQRKKHQQEEEEEEEEEKRRSAPAPVAAAPPAAAPSDVAPAPPAAAAVQATDGVAEELEADADPSQSAAPAAKKKRATKFDKKEKKKFVTGGATKRNKTRKYGVSACETKLASEDMNNLSGDAFQNS
eukprot:TRINITY_DN393_c0_g1_i1.p1 TRINITY_DN393_c0_g1~~TRINITY_DN393_c0_g1_i1.p1  ORF type:complete len:450 (+),score=186.53 TRINITY_DN393_c0_g1_i1:63-1352(+)